MDAGAKTDRVFRRIAWDEFDGLHRLFPDNEQMWQKYREMRRKEFVRRETDVYVIQQNGAFVGEVTASYTSHTLAAEAIPGQRAYLQAYRLEEDHQGRGLGQKLLQFALSDLEQRGYTEFTIGVEEENERAKHIYFKLGFTEMIDKGRGDEFDPTDYTLYLRRVQKNEFKTPFGRIVMLNNGRAMPFRVERSRYGMYLNDGTFKRPQGLYRLYPCMEELEKGDIIVCEFDGGTLQRDGGDEFMLNIVGGYQGYTIGMGVPDSEDIERHYSRQERVLPYETRGSTGKGFEVHIIDDPKKYICEKEFQKLCFIAAWEPGTTDEAWDLISFVTC